MLAQTNQKYEINNKQTLNTKMWQKPKVDTDNLEEHIQLIQIQYR